MSVQGHEQHPPAPPPYVVERPPRHSTGPLDRALARARTGAAGVTPVDRTAARIQRALVMAALAGGWALSRSTPRFALVLPAVAMMLLAACVHPRLSLPRLVSGWLLPLLRIARPSIGVEDPAPHRLGDAASGLALAVASPLVLTGVLPAAGWALAWVVTVAALVEFTFDVSVGALLLRT